MSRGALAVLARLAGAKRVPPAALYGCAWPGRLQRLGQLAFTAVQWCVYRRSALVFTGAGLPAAKGALHVQGTLRLQDWLQGAYVMGGAERTRLAHALKLDADPAPDFYLADADVLVVLGQRNGHPAVVHVSDDAERLQRYSHCASMARDQLASVGLGQLVPAMLYRGPVLDLQMLAQERLVGRTVRAGDLSAEELNLYVQAALRPLQRLAAGASLSVEGADSAVLAELPSALEPFRSLDAATRVAFAALRDWPGRWRHPAVLAHGDYWLSNILFAQGATPAVSGLLDWERSRPDACAGYDALHLVMFTFAAWRGCSPLQVLCMVWDGLCEPTLERLLSSVQIGLGLTVDDLRHVAIELWLLHLCRHAVDSPKWDDRRRREWLEDPADSVERWLTARR
jgi:hypothetical protein